MDALADKKAEMFISRYLWPITAASDSVINIMDVKTLEKIYLKLET